MEKKPIILIDGNNFLFRAYHSVIKLNLKNKLGEPTGATKVYINMLESLKKEYKDSVISVVFDAHAKTFRHEVYPQYKAERKPMDLELKVQIPIIKSIIKAMGLMIIEIPGVEADDVLGTYAKQAEAQDLKLIIASGDKDLCSLISEHVSIVDTMKKKVLDREYVIEKFGVPPELITDYLALCGDSIDNIPGMNGIGAKTAAFLLNEIGDIDSIKNNLDKIASLSFRKSKNFKEDFLAQEQNIRLYRFLTSIKLDVELEYTINELKNTEPEHEILYEYFKRLDFNSLMLEEKNILKEKGITQTTNKPDFSSLESYTLTQNQVPEVANIALDNTINISNVESNNLQYGKFDIQDIKKWKICYEDSDISELLLQIKDDNVVISVVPSKGNYLNIKIVGLAIYTNNISGYIPFNDNFFGVYAEDEFQRRFTLINRLIENKKIIVYDAKLFKHFLANSGIEFSKVCDDLSLLAHIYDSSIDINLDYLTKFYFNHELTRVDTLLGKGAKALGFEDIDIEQVAQYQKEVVYSIGKLWEVLSHKLSAEVNYQIYIKEELPLVNVLCAMERAGIKLNEEVLAQQSKNLHIQLEEKANDILSIVGQQFNINSPSQVAHILYDVLNLPILAKTPKGEPSTSEEVLQELIQYSPLPQKILEYRELNKLLNTYVDKLGSWILSKTNRLHAKFNQCGTNTGRLSSSEPNIQNIPIRTDEGRAVRKAFDARKGYKILAADYSQIELRILAHIAQDENMIDAFNKNIDIHASTASEMFKIPLDQVDSTVRRKAKAINFGLIYGMSAHGLAKQINVPRKEAKIYMDAYFQQYPKVKLYMENIVKFAATHGYVETFNGKKLNFNKIFSAKGVIKSSIERAAINAPMQGSAAQIIKQAMIEIYNLIKDKQDEILMVLQVHDELVFEIREDKVDEYADKIVDIMQNVAKLKVPLKVEVGVSDNWSGAH